MSPATAVEPLSSTTLASIAAYVPNKRRKKAWECSRYPLLPPPGNPPAVVFRRDQGCAISCHLVTNGEPDTDESMRDLFD